MSEVKLSVHELELGKYYKLNIVSVKEDSGKRDKVKSIDYEITSKFLKDSAKDRNDVIDVVYSDAYDSIYYMVNRNYKVKMQFSDADFDFLLYLPDNLPHDGVMTRLLINYSDFFIDHQDKVIIPVNGRFTYYLEPSYNKPETEVTKRYNRNDWVKSQPITVDPISCMDDNYITNVLNVMSKKSEENYYLHQSQLFKLYMMGEINSPDFIRSSLELSHIDPNRFYMEFKIYRVLNTVIYLRSQGVDRIFMQTQDKLNNPEKYLIRYRKEVSNRISGLKHLVTTKTFKNSEEESEFITGDLKRNVSNLMSVIEEYEKELKTVKDKEVI